MKTGIGLLLLALLTTGCSSAYYQSEGYAGDDLYGIHNKTKIAQREKAKAEAEKAEAEARRAKWEALMAQAQAVLRKIDVAVRILLADHVEVTLQDHGGMVLIAATTARTTSTIWWRTTTKAPTNDGCGASNRPPTRCRRATGTSVTAERSTT